MPLAFHLRTRLEEIRTHIAHAVSNPDAVKIVAVTKALGDDAIRAVRAVGLDAIGENYAQECIAKHSRVILPIEWHFIGQLQRRKVRMLASFIDVWHSVDRKELVDELAVYAPGSRIYVQRNMSDDSGRGGAAAKDVSTIVSYARDVGLIVEGLMCVAVPGAPGDVAMQFRSLRQQADKLGLVGLSMGMSSDYQLALQEGATVLRLGTALFGAR